MDTSQTDSRGEACLGALGCTQLFKVLARVLCHEMHRRSRYAAEDLHRSVVDEVGLRMLCWARASVQDHRPHTQLCQQCTCMWLVL
jgi:hypothetical protein